MESKTSMNEKFTQKFTNDIINFDRFKTSMSGIRLHS